MSLVVQYLLYSLVQGTALGEDALREEWAWERHC